MHKKIFLFIIFISIIKISKSQVLSWSPLLPGIKDTITIIYNAAAEEGNLELKDYKDTIWAHTGLILKNSGKREWKYIKSEWGVNAEATRLKPLGNNKYQIKFQIQSFYNVPDTVKIEKLAFVFRNSDGSKVGRQTNGMDFTIPISNEFSCEFIAPTAAMLGDGWMVFNKSSWLEVAALASTKSKLSLFLNGTKIAESTDTQIKSIISGDEKTKNDTTLRGRDFYLAKPGKNFLTVIADNGVIKAYDSLEIDYDDRVETEQKNSGDSVAHEFSIKYVEELYSQGKYQEALAEINGISKNFYQRAETSLSKDDWGKLNILLAQINIELKNYSEVTKSFKTLLMNFPNFYPSDNLYQEDFYNYFDNMRVKPLLLFGVHLARSFPIYFTTKVYSVYDSINYAVPNKRNRDKGTKCYAEGASLQYNFYRNFALVGDLFYSKTSYKRTLTTNGTDEFDLKYSEISYSNDFGLSLKKYLYNVDHHPILTLSGSGILGGGFGPYISLGGHYSHLRQALGDIELNSTSTDRQTQIRETKKISSNNIDVKNMRNSNRWGIDMALGSSLKLKRALLSVEVKYLLDFTPYTNSANRYNNSELLYNYYYIDNAFTLSRLNVSISMAPILHYSVKSKIK